jgi:hypothetical protein
MVRDAEMGMARDFRVDGRSNEDLHRLASRARGLNGLTGQVIVDIVTLLRSGWITTIAGKKRLVLEIVDDSELGGDDAITTIEKMRVMMRVKRSVWASATETPKIPEGLLARRRAKFTLSHEFSHAFLNHDKAPMARGTGVSAATAKMPSFIEPYRSAEHQANEMAAHVLIDQERARLCSSIEEIVATFDVNHSTAKILFNKFAQEKKNKVVSDGFAKLSEFLSPQSQRKKNCISCKGQIPFLGADRCDQCKTTGSALPDGDHFFNPELEF